jgi:hypothetical protein
VTDVVGEHHHVGVRDDLGVPPSHVSTGVGVDGSVDEAHRHCGFAHGAHPSIAVRVAVAQEPSDLVHHPFAVVVFEDLVESRHQLA